MKPKIGFTGRMREDIVKDLHFAIRHNFDFYEIPWAAKNFNLKDSFIKEIKKLSKRNNISLNLHTTISLPICSVIPEVARAALNFAKKEVILAKRVGAKIITIHGGTEDAPRRIFKRVNLKVLVRNLKELVALGKKLGIRIGLENSWRSPALCIKATDLLNVVNSVRDLGIVLDVGHANAAGYNPSSYFKRVKNFVINMHIHDNNGEYDQHNLIGKGNINFQSLFRECKKANYYGPFILEISPQNNILKGRKKLLKFWN